MPPIAMALLPCQNSALGISLTLLHCNRKIRANVLALTAADTVVDARRFALNLVIELQNFLWAYPDTETASLTPQFVDDYAEAFRQEIHLPPQTVIRHTLSTVISIYCKYQEYNQKRRTNQVKKSTLRELRDLSKFSRHFTPYVNDKKNESMPLKR
jgi:hypothetical protein